MYFRYLLLAVSLVLVPCAVPQDDLELRVEVLEAEVVEIKDNVEDVETDVSQITGQLFEVMNDVDDIDEVTDTQEQSIGALEKENSLLQAQLAELQARLHVLEQAQTSTNHRVDALNETVSDLDIDNSTNERLDALESDVTILESNITTLENDVTYLEIDVTELGESTDQRLTDLEESTVDYSDTAFLATISSETFTPEDPIVFDNAIVNPGGHYNPAEGVYTVPVDGIYQFVLHYLNYEDTDSAVYLEVDNSKVAYSKNTDPDYSTHSADLVILLHLTAEQGVWLSPLGFGKMYGSGSGIMY